MTARQREKEIGIAIIIQVGGMHFIGGKRFGKHHRGGETSLAIVEVDGDARAIIAAAHDVDGTVAVQITRAGDGLLLNQGQRFVQGAQSIEVDMEA